MSSRCSFRRRLSPVGLGANLTLTTPWPVEQRLHGRTAARRLAAALHTALTQRTPHRGTGMTAHWRSPRSLLRKEDRRVRRRFTTSIQLDANRTFTRLQRPLLLLCTVCVTSHTRRRPLTSHRVKFSSSAEVNRKRTEKKWYAATQWQGS